jgi:hypothetical protein
MGCTCVCIDARLRDTRSTRQRCAASLKAVLRELAELRAKGAPKDRQAAIAAERAAVEAALEHLLAPAVPLGPMLDKIEKEQWAAVEAVLKQAEEPSVSPRTGPQGPELPAPSGAEMPEPTPEPEIDADALLRRIEAERAERRARRLVMA